MGEDLGEGDKEYFFVFRISRNPLVVNWVHNSL